MAPAEQPQPYSARQLAWGGVPALVSLIEAGFPIGRKAIDLLSSWQDLLRFPEFTRDPWPAKLGGLVDRLDRNAIETALREEIAPATWAEDHRAFLDSIACARSSGEVGKEVEGYALRLFGDLDSWRLAVVGATGAGHTCPAVIVDELRGLADLIVDSPEAYLDLGPYAAAHLAEFDPDLESRDPALAMTLDIYAALAAADAAPPSAADSDWVLQRLRRGGAYSAAYQAAFAGSNKTGPTLSGNSGPPRRRRARRTGDSRSTYRHGGGPEPGEGGCTEP